MFDFSNFLKSGALLRHIDLKSSNPRIWTLASGPFSISEFHNNDELSICWPDFYFQPTSQKLNYYSTLNQTQLTTQELKELCINFLNNLKKSDSNAKKTSEWNWSSLNQHHFLESYHQIQKDIAHGDVQKAVLSLFAKSQNTPNSRERVEILLKLIELPFEMHVFGFWTPEKGVLGATPEILFEREGHYLKSMSLAGTRIKKNFAQDLLLDSKELQEHQWVIEEIKKNLSLWGEVQQSKTEVLVLPQLEHLQTLFSVQLNDPQISHEEILKALHPTPALGAFPKNYVTQKMIQFPEQEHRWGFGAPLSFLFPNQKWLSLVTIRSLLWNSNSSQIGVGCGIVKESQKEKEWLELNAKYKSILMNLGLEHE
ncbi:MAG TPA: chorismate-binding protein [Pseudobdellovibrionaceae bacterium]|nr:chorismate-binding protein [Pseudobdellovibrionaceae bacterium]